MLGRGRRHSTLGVAALVLLVLLIIGACGTDDSDDDSSRPSRSTTSSASRATTPTAGVGSSTSTSLKETGTSAPTTEPTPPESTTTAATEPPDDGDDDDVTRGSGSASDLDATADCEGTPPRAVVRLRWTPSGEGPQRVDVSVLDNGFEPGTYDSSGTLTSTTASLEWSRSRGEATHYWRVVTDVDGRLTASATASFPGPGCVGSDPQQP